MKKLLVYLSLLIINLLTISCTKQAGVSTFISLGKIQDGSIEFSFNEANGNIVNVGDVLRVKPTKLTTVNAKIVDCKIKEGTTALPSGFSVNPLTCEIVGATLSSLTETIYTLEVTNSLGKKSDAQVSLRIRAQLNFSGMVSGLTAGQSVEISQIVNGLLKETITINDNGSYQLQNIFDGDTFQLTTTHSDSASYTCTPGTTSAVAYTNVINNISCYGSGGRVLSANVIGLGSGGTVTLRMTSNSNTYELTNVGNGANSFPALIVNDPYTVSVVSTSTGFGCFVQSGATGTISSGTNSVSIQCAANGPYTFTVKTRGITAGLVSLRKNGTLLLNGVSNGDHVLVGTGADQYYGTDYTFSIDGIPANHTCSLSSTSGIVTGNTVVNLTCNALTFSVGGFVSGLSGGDVLKIQSLTKDGRKEISLTSDSSFSFDPYEYNTPYELILTEVPSNKVCSFTNTNYKNGNILGNITDANITCAARSNDRCDVGNLKLDTFNGTINDVSCDSTHMYVAGSFTSVGEQALGFFSALNSTDGSVNDPRSPAPFGGYGNVSSILSDNEGGVYIGSWGNKGIEYYDSNFILKKTILASGDINNMVIDGDNLYALSSNYLYKVNRFTGIADTVFNAKNLGYDLDFLVFLGNSMVFARSGAVYSSLTKYNKNTGISEGAITIKSDGARLYGLYEYNDELFIVLNGSNSDGHRLLRYRSDGTFVRGYSFNGSIRKIVFYNSNLIAVGFFSNVESSSRNGFVEIDLSTNALSNSVTGLISSDMILDLYLNEIDKKMYFNTSNSSITFNGSITKKGIFAFDLETKSFLNFNIQNVSATSIASFQNRVYVGGSFVHTNSVPKNGLASLKLSTGKFDTNKAFTIDSNSVQKIYHDKVNNKLTVLGDFSSSGGVSNTNYIAKFNTSDGTLDSVFRSPGFGTSLSGTRVRVFPDEPTNPTSLYVVGYFNQAGGMNRKKIAKLNYTTGAVDTGFDLELNRIKPSDGITNEDFFIYDMIVTDSGLTLGGNFTHAKSSSLYPYLVRVDHFGNLLDSSKQFSTISYPSSIDYAYVSKILNHGSNLYISGSFTDYEGDPALDSSVNLIFNGSDEPIVSTPKIFNTSYNRICTTSNGYIYSYYGGIYRKTFGSDLDVLRSNIYSSSLFCVGESVIAQYPTGVLVKID